MQYFDFGNRNHPNFKPAEKKTAIEIVIEASKFDMTKISIKRHYGTAEIQMIGKFHMSENRTYHPTATSILRVQTYLRENGHKISDCFISRFGIQLDYLL